MELFIKCYICDAQLANDDIKYTPEYGRGGFAPCAHCEEVISEVFEPLLEEEIDAEIAAEGYYDELLSNDESTNVNEETE